MLGLFILPLFNFFQWHTKVFETNADTIIGQAA